MFLIVLAFGEFYELYMSTHPTIELAINLIRQPSVTPDDNGCQQIIADRLSKIGFACEHLRFENVDNLLATHGSGAPFMVFAGHTDVVPPGADELWKHPAFSATQDDGFIYGRGAADMKGGVAAMVHATEQFIATHPDHQGTIGLLLTSDEEGPAINGTRKVVDYLTDKNIKIDYCLLGEPSSTEILGDAIKVGRRGSISGWMTILGKEGHIAYPHLADNPIHKLSTVIETLTNEAWDSGNEFFPPTSFQVANVSAGEGTGNVIPGQARLNFNFRYSSQLDAQTIIKRTHGLLDSLDIDYELEWQAFGKPFITESGKLIDAATSAIKSFTGLDTELSTSGGTSDGRFIAPTGTQVVELGPINASIHKINERVSAEDLIKLTSIYTHICERLLVKD